MSVRRAGPYNLETASIRWFAGTDSGAERVTLESSAQMLADDAALLGRGAFLARDLDWVGAQPDDGEWITVQPTALECVRDQLRAGVLRDAKTIAVLGTYFARIGYH